MSYSPTLGRWLETDPVAEVGRQLDSGADESSFSPVVADAINAVAERTWGKVGQAHAADWWLWHYADGANLYQFVGSNPIRYTDPSGLANTTPGANGGVCYLPCTHDRLTCMSNCIEANDPFNLLEKGLLSGAGGPIPKALVRALGGRTTTFGGGASRFTTLPSVASTAARAGGRSTLRVAGRLSFWAWLVYADYMAGVEAHCLGACAGDPCAY